MSAVKLFRHLLEIDSRILSKEERMLLEADLLTRLCNELKKYFYLNCELSGSSTILSYKIMEKTVCDEQLARNIIVDILSSGEYLLEGIAYYTQTHEDVICEIYEGRNTNPSSILLRRIIELHRMVRPVLYKNIMNKIRTIYQSEI